MLCVRIVEYCHDNHFWKEYVIVATLVLFLNRWLLCFVLEFQFKMALMALLFFKGTSVLDYWWSAKS